MSKRKNKDISHAKYHNKPVNIKCVVSGKSLAPYCIPRTIRIDCDKEVMDSDACANCKMRKIKDKIIELPAVDENVLSFIDVSKHSIYTAIKHMLNIKCSFSYEAIEMQNIERIYTIPITSRERHKTSLAPISFYAGHGLDVNTTYNMEGYTTVNPKDQTSTHVFTSATKIKSDIESFDLVTSHKKLKEFCIPNPTVLNIYDRLEKIYKYYASNITKIHNRFDLHLAVDLAFKSVLSYKFDNELVHKGWIDAMVIGDTRCGKGYVAERLSNYFGLGEVISGENCSFAGLIAGLQQFNNHWVVTWGKIPLNDGGLVVLDEASSISQDDWSKLSRVRSEGIAEITKIHTQITSARTRMIFLCNPKLKKVANYSYGIQSILDIVKAPEDIARFDYVLVVAHDEVSMSDINRHHKLAPEMYSSNLEQALTLWVWSRKTDDIIFSDEAVKLAYSLSIKLAKEYSFSVPLIQGENVRVKLSKIAVAFAARLYSYKQNGKILYVDKVHIECAYYFFNLIYKKSDSGYYAMSKLQKVTEYDAVDRDFSQVEKYLNAFTKRKDEICKCLLTNNNITVNDISEHVNLDKEISREIVSTLLKHNCIIKKYQYYIKTPAFTKWLKDIILDPNN